MAGIKLKIHPLFFVFGLYYALTGRIFIFLIYTIIALVHELGHSFIASHEGYILKNITLLPFGAVISGNIEGLRLKDEILVALGGPSINLITAVVFVALWWFFPATYAFTGEIVTASVSLAVINLLPVFPLDGGRILLATLCGVVKRKTAQKICFILAMLFAALFFALFILTIFYKINITLLFFGLFLVFGNFPIKKENKYVKLYSEKTEDSLLRGKPYKKQAISGEANIKTLINILDENAVNEIDVFLNGKKIKELNELAVFSAIEKNDIYTKLKDI